MAFVLVSLLGLLTAGLAESALSYRALWLRDHPPRQYVGFWRWLGDATRDRRRPLALTAGLVAGGVIAALIDTVFSTGRDGHILLMI